MSVTYILQDQRGNAPMEMFVTGRDRHLYFRRPVAPVVQVGPPQMEVVPQAHPEAQQSMQQQSQEHSKTIGIQTIFRESEAQTNPYTPDFSIKQGETPEVLRITHFTYGNGLPASMAEMELIEQAREKAAFEESLPPTTDQACFQLRRKLMEEQEIKEWAKREDDIKKVQQERLNLLQSALLDRERENEDRNLQRIEELRLRKTEQKDRALAKIQRKRIKVLRKMFKQRKEVQIQKPKRDIIEEYANFGSIVYAGITREGLSLDKLANKYEIQPEALTHYQGLVELNNTMPQQALETVIDIVTHRKTIQKPKGRQEARHKRALKDAYEELTAKQAQGEALEEEKKGKGKETIAPRPPTPEQERLKVDEERLDAAVILIQRLIRGRAIQNVMYENKEKRLDLIHELRDVGEMTRVPEATAQQQMIQFYIQRVQDGIAEAIQGGIISETLDALSKELVRLKQEALIAAKVRAAEKERTIKESEESGRRQAEIVLRQRAEQLLKEIMFCHQSAADSYLHGIIRNTVNHVAQQQALEEANIKVLNIHHLVTDLEERMNRPEQIVRQLLYNFLLPECQRTRVQRLIRLEEKRYVVAARKSLLKAVDRTRDKM